MTTPAPSMMTPERWRAVDEVLQGALTCERERRDEFVAQSCGSDAALRGEVTALLAIFDATPPGFLERSAIEEHGLSSATAPATRAAPRRMISARTMVRATAAAILLGAVVGWAFAQSSTSERWRKERSAANTATLAAGWTISPHSSSGLSGSRATANQ